MRAFHDDHGEQMSDVGWRVLENIVWAAMAFALFWWGDGWWKVAAVVPLTFCKPARRLTQHIRTDIQMTYDQLCHRCRRIMGFSPDSTHSPLDCMRFLKDYSSDGARAITAEMMARELAEFIEDHRSFYVASGAGK